MSDYIHGYNEQEFQRLLHQAEFLAPYIFENLDFSSSKKILEPGCGVGAQTRIIAKISPNAQIVSFDRAEAPILKAKEWLLDKPELSKRIRFLQTDPIKLQENYSNYFDTCYICWMLEHIAEPVPFLSGLKPLLQVEGRILLTEVQNNSLVFSPECPIAMRFWKAICDYQLSIYGDPNVGMKCAAYLQEAGFREIVQRPYTMFIDTSAPQKLKSMLLYWVELMRSVSPFLPPSLWDGVEKEMHELSEQPQAAFSYTFIQTEGLKK
jgi:ubiquinone/menaquinone biosynthesis C-methylase UbiE